MSPVYLLPMSPVHTSCTLYLLISVVTSTLPGQDPSADCEEWVSKAFWRSAAVEAVADCLEAGADPSARDKSGKSPWDYAKDNEALKGTDAYWRLNDLRF